MKKTEFKNKYLQNILLSAKSTSPIDCNTFDSDLQSVLQDELEKFAIEWDEILGGKFTNTGIKEIVKNYLNKKP